MAIGIKKRFRNRGAVLPRIGCAVVHSGALVAHHAASGGRLRVVTLDRQFVGQPVDLARDVVVDLGEPECVEPARGSCAEVSERVPAVDDHGPLAVEHARGRRIELLERKVHRARQVVKDEAHLVGGRTAGG